MFCFGTVPCLQCCQARRVESLEAANDLLQRELDETRSQILLKDIRHKALQSRVHDLLQARDELAESTASQTQEAAKWRQKAVTLQETIAFMMRAKPGSSFGPCHACGTVGAIAAVGRFDMHRSVGDCQSTCATQAT